MSGRIVLSDDEKAFFAERLNGWITGAVAEFMFQLCDEEGDPVGTVRHSKGGSATAVRIGGIDEPDDWRVTWSDGRSDWRSFSVVSKWPVIYSPGVS